MIYPLLTNFSLNNTMKRPVSFASVASPSAQKTRQPTTYHNPSIWVRTLAAKGLQLQTVIPPVVQHIGLKNAFKFSLYSVDSKEVFTPKVAEKHSLDDYNTLVFTVGNDHYLTRTFPASGIDHLVAPPVLVKKGAYRQSELPIGKPRTGRILAMMYEPTQKMDSNASGYQKLMTQNAENNFTVQAKKTDIEDLPFLRLETLDLTKEKSPSILKFPPCPYPVLYVLATNPDDASGQALISQNNSVFATNRNQQILLPANTPHEVILDGNSSGVLLRIVDPKRS